MGLRTTGRTSASLALSMAAVLALPLGAAAQAPEPGVWWESTVELQSKGFAMPAQTTRLCVPKKGLSEPPSAPDDSGECRVEHFKRTGNKMTWKIRCEGEQPVSGEGEMVQTATSYDARILMRTAEGEMPMKMKGHLVGGDCDASASKREAAARQKEAEKLQAEAQAQVQGQQAALCETWIEEMNLTALQLPVGPCADAKYKSRFCDRLGSRDGYAIVSARGDEALQQAGATCRKDLGALRTSLCSAAGTEAQGSRSDPKALQFVGERCPVESRAIAQKQCAGRSYTGLEGHYREFCTRYAGEQAAAGTQPAAGKAPARSVKDEAVERGKEALKGLFGF